MKAGTACAIETVVKAINTHIDNPDLCQKGCGVLNNMVNENSKNCKSIEQNQTNSNK